jgi:hypothetical protein
LDVHAAKIVAAVLEADTGELQTGAAVVENNVGPSALSFRPVALAASSEMLITRLPLARNRGSVAALQESAASGLPQSDKTSSQPNTTACEQDQVSWPRGVRTAPHMIAGAGRLFGLAAHGRPQQALAGGVANVADRLLETDLGCVQLTI